MALSFQELFGPGGVASPPKHAAAGGEEERGEGGGLADLTALVAGAVGEHVAHLSKGWVAPAARGGAHKVRGRIRGRRALRGKKPETGLDFFTCALLHMPCSEA